MLIDESYKEIRDMMSKFADGEVAPHAHDTDKNGVIPDSIRKGLIENGFMGIYIPEEYGGAGMDYMSYAIMIDEMSRACASTGVLLSAHNSLAVWPILTFGTEETKVEAANKFHIGEADWDGAAVTAVRPIHFKDEFVGEWRAIDLTSSSSFEEVYNHRLYDDKVQVVIQASSTNDGSTPVETLSMAGLLNNLGLDVNNGTLALDPDTGGGGDQDIAGVVAGAFTGSFYLDRSVAVKYDNKTITVKNVKDDLFYKDYDGAAKQTGFIRVLVKKLGF